MTQKRFGCVLRACRLGYHEMEGVGWVRLTAGFCGNPHLVEVVPLDDFRGLRVHSGEHVCWWEGDTALIEATIRRHVPQEATVPLVLLLDDDGNNAEETP